MSRSSFISSNLSSNSQPFLDSVRADDCDAAREDDYVYTINRCLGILSISLLLLLDDHLLHLILLIVFNRLVLNYCLFAGNLISAECDANRAQ